MKKTILLGCIATMIACTPTKESTIDTTLQSTGILFSIALKTISCRIIINFIAKKERIKNPFLLFLVGFFIADLAEHEDHGIDQDHDQEDGKHAVAGIIPQDAKHAVIIMFSNDKDDPHWCLQYKGNGHYFDTFQQLMNYVHSRRFKKPQDLIL